MKKVLGTCLIVVGIVLYLLAALVLAGKVHYSFHGLWLTLSDGVLLANFIAAGVGALAPGAVVHYVGHRLVRSARTPKPA